MKTPLPPDTPLSLVFQQYRETRIRKNSTLYTVRSFRASLRRLKCFLERDPLVSDLTLETIEALQHDMQSLRCSSLIVEWTFLHLTSLRRFADAMRSTVRPSQVSERIELDACSVAGGSTEFTFCCTEVTR